MWSRNEFPDRFAMSLQQEHRLLEELPPMSVDVKRRKDDDKGAALEHFLLETFFFFYMGKPCVCV